MENQTEERTLSLSDRLALDRTGLANERTFLAYVRTFIGMLATGVMRYLAVARNLQKILTGEPAGSYG